MTAPRRPVAAPAAPLFCSGDVLHLTRSASPQFVRPIVVRVIRTLDWSTYDGWCWVDGYQLGPDGAATARRSLFVRTEGVFRRTDRPPVQKPLMRRPVPRTPVRAGA